MKKKRLAALCVLMALLLAAGAWGFAAWRRDSVPLKISAHDMPLDSGRDVMQIRLESFTASQVSGMQTLRTVNRTGEDLSEIVLRVFANGPELLGTGERAVDVTGMYVNDEPVSFAFDEEDPTVLRAQYAWKDGEEIELRWHMSAPIDGDVALLSLPVLGVYEDGAWRTDAWDPLVQGGCAQAFDMEIWMEYNEWDVVFGGALLDYDDNPSGRIAQARMLGARDVTLLMTKAHVVRYREAAGVKVAAVADSAFAAERLLDDCETALESLASAGFAYPFPALTAAQLDTGYADGYAASCFVVLGEEKDGEARLRRLTRLIARQTFGTLAGYDPWNAPWLSHTLASTAELLAYRQRKGEAAFETRFFEEIEVSTRLTRPYGVTVGAEVIRFGGDGEMTQVLRDQGAAMMLGIGEAIGCDALTQALNQYAADNAGRIADRQNLEAELETVSGSSWTGYLEDELYY